LVRAGTNGLSEAIPAIYAALGEELPNDLQPGEPVQVEPVEELLLELRNPQIVESDGIRRATATAELTYIPADGSRQITSRQYRFTAPLGPVELEEMRWYIERYYQWPTGCLSSGRSRRNAAPAMGPSPLRCRPQRRVGAGAVGGMAADQRQSALFGAGGWGAAGRYAPDEEAARLREAASDLLSLPWEILHDGDGYLSQGANGARVRRRLPNRKPTTTLQADLPIRVLLISPRPEVDGDGNPVGYLDHRVSAKALVQAVADLGTDLVKVDLLSPPTFPAMTAALQRAREENDPYEIVHFDGHGVYDRRVGLGALCFEDPRDRDKLGQRLLKLIHAPELAAELRHYGVPLIFLEACQTAQATEDPMASVAARLLEEGVGSVVAMSHSVWWKPPAALWRRFTARWRRGSGWGMPCWRGRWPSTATPTGAKRSGRGTWSYRTGLCRCSTKMRQTRNCLPSQWGGMRPGWTETAARAVWETSPRTEHHFVGRSRQLLHLERLLQQEPYAVIARQRRLGQNRPGYGVGPLVGAVGAVPAGGVCQR
jgi:hypothetical protein